MTLTPLPIAQPFFDVCHVADAPSFAVAGSAIVLNLGAAPLQIEGQTIPPLQSAVVRDVMLGPVSAAVVITRVSDQDDAALMAEVRKAWPTAFDVRGEERLRGVAHYMSPKAWVGPVGLSFYHSASVPLNVGLHKDHPFCPVPGFREVHTQIIGFGKMQQCREKDIATLYLEEPMAPGATHRPMFDDKGNYPWHQYETITPGIFMAVELLPDEAVA